MSVYKMVDRATPPTSAELSMLKTSGIYAVGGYVGGVNNGGRAWTAHHAGLVWAAGFEFLPIYVGENACDGCKTPVELTKAEGDRRRA